MGGITYDPSSTLHYLLCVGRSVHVPKYSGRTPGLPVWAVARRTPAMACSSSSQVLRCRRPALAPPVATLSVLHTSLLGGSGREGFGVSGWPPKTGVWASPLGATGATGKGRQNIARRKGTCVLMYIGTSGSAGNALRWLGWVWFALRCALHCTPSHYVL
jgi:hypothetical protein